MGGFFYAFDYLSQAKDKNMNIERINLSINSEETKPETSYRELAADFSKLLTKRPVALKKIENVLKYSRNNAESLIIVSTVCPPYSSDSEGRPTYKELEVGIEYNISEHLKIIPPAVGYLQEKGLGVKHIFLMADTEVDLIPFLQNKLRITPEEFLSRCQMSVEAISERVQIAYPNIDYSEIPRASRFLSYFGEKNWYLRYEHFKARLEEEMKVNRDVAYSLQRDARYRSILIESLLGRVTEEQMVEHIVRQKAQYMAFASLMRDRFPNRLVVINHATPNFAWMNDKIAREPLVLDQSRGNYLPEIPLVELDISTMPGGEK